jgi:hypothetical protein
MRSLISTWSLTAVAILVVAGSPQSTRASTIVYDAGVDLKNFELTVNPASGTDPGINTVVPEWSYGTETGASVATPNSTTFTVFPKTASYNPVNLPSASGNMAGWQYDNVPMGDLVPAIAVNTTNSTVSSCCGNYGVNQIWTHPGGSTGDEFTVVRWTAAAFGKVTISGTFLEEGGVSSSDYIQVGGVTEASGLASAGTLTVGPTYVAAGETIDFITGPNVALGYGANSTSFDGTVTFTPVPEPSSVVALCGIGVMGLFLIARRRNKRCAGGT